ncbi:peptide MFS transporter [Clostridium frigidicarnis]|uniref:Proton-dependent oligopeptide transporter, POT family n=1 Tax=Clostridium frigidicarnis TaxID=84698 RepID=A0A1I0XPF6_9CLOT|nr:peptide MFS transporter [Clostridium frigidicarnis]SFB02784.1 proton-dependent oligopeptide transporter, POT family [Clostridium frigidicarnis]
MELKQTNNEMTNEVSQIKTGKMKHPPGLYLLFFTEMWERFSYYGMRALLVMYLTTELIRGGLGVDKASALRMYGNFAALVYLTPIIGGYISDRYIGQRKAITIGGIIIALGQFTLFSNQSMMALYIGLFLLIVGNGFFKPNISTLVGQLYPQGDKRKDSAFTIFYMGINLGSFIAPLVCGALAENIMATKEAGEIIHYGFRYGFLAAGIGMVIGQILFNLLSDKYLGNLGKTTVGKAKNTVDKEALNKPLTKQEKHRTIVICILAAFVVVFWTGFEQAGSSLTIYTQDYVNRKVGGWEMPVSWFQSLNPFFIVLCGIPVSKLWIKLASREKGDLGIPAKMALGMIMLGLGFLLMVGAVMQRGGNVTDTAVKANMLWLVGAYFLHTMGELCLSPVGLSMVSSLAPAKFASLLMGVWLCSSFIANEIAGIVASYTETLGHLEIFGGIAVVSIVIGLVLLSLNKKLAAMMK